ncbi:SnoaL-like domain protein [compost metagenome]
MTIDPAISSLLDGWLQAVRASDASAIASHYSPDVVAFDAIQQLQFRGIEAYIAHWQYCMTQCSEPTFEMHELHVESAGDVAFGHYLALCGGTNEKGERGQSWMRASIGLRREQGQWKIAHEHFSAPFDMASGAAIFDAQP